MFNEISNQARTNSTKSSRALEAEQINKAAYRYRRWLVGLKHHWRKWLKLTFREIKLRGGSIWNSVRIFFEATSLEWLTRWKRKIGDNWKGQCWERSKENQSWERGRRSEVDSWKGGEREGRSSASTWKGLERACRERRNTKVASYCW